MEIRKKVSYETDKELEGLRWLAKVIDFGVGLTVYTAINELYTAHLMLRDIGGDLYKREVKRYANDAVNSAQLKYGQQLCLMTNRGFYDTYATKIVDLASDDITKFRISIKQTLDSLRYERAELVSYVETARALLDSSVRHFQIVVETAAEDYSLERKYISKSLDEKRLKKKWSVLFCDFDMSDVLKKWEKVCDILYKSDEGIDLNTENSVKLFDNMCKKFAEGEYVDACLEEAREKYPEFIENKIIAKE